MPKKPETLRTDWLGSLVGLATFVAGIGLLAVTFQLAYQLFSVPPEVAIGDNKGEAVNLARAGQSFAALVVKAMLLLVMSVVGSVIANRGIRLYVTCRTPAPPTAETPESERIRDAKERTAV